MYLQLTQRCRKMQNADMLLLLSLLRLRHRRNFLRSCDDYDTMYVRQRFIRVFLRYLGYRTTVSSNLFSCVLSESKVSVDAEYIFPAERAHRDLRERRRSSRVTATTCCLRHIILFISLIGSDSDSTVAWHSLRCGCSLRFPRMNVLNSAIC